MSSRNLETEYLESNPLYQWPKKAGIPGTIKNIVITEFSKLLPLKMKNVVLRKLGIEIGEDTAIALGVQMDIFYPEKIEIGSGTVIGYGATILTHEATTKRFSTGEVSIGDDVLIGANVTVLPGVEIGEGAVISANSLVDRDIKPEEKVAGVPVKNIEDS